jgi:hypothetical protein
MPVSSTNPNHYGQTAGYYGGGECESCHTFHAAVGPTPGGSITTTVTVSGAGAHTIEYWGKDVADNEETPHKTASFTIGAVVNYTITASAGAGGVIAPSGAQVVAAGSGLAFTITPNSGYHVASVLVDGASVGAVTSYTFTNVVAGHTIAATFAANGTLPNSSLTIRSTRSAPYIGQTFILSGLARPTPDMVGRNMHVDVKKPNKAYWAYSSARTIYVGPSGTAEWWYRYYLDPRKVASGLVARGTYLFKGVYDGDGFLPCQSPTLSVLVR